MKYRVAYQVASSMNYENWLPRNLVVEASSPEEALETARSQIVVKTALRTKLEWVSGPLLNRYSGRITANVFAESEEQAQAIFDDAFPYTHDQGGCVDLIDCDVVLEEEDIYKEAWA